MFQRALKPSMLRIVSVHNPINQSRLEKVPLKKKNERKRETRFEGISR